MGQLYLRGSDCFFIQGDTSGIDYYWPSSTPFTAATTLPTSNLANVTSVCIDGIVITAEGAGAATLYIADKNNVNLMSIPLSTAGTPPYELPIPLSGIHVPNGVSVHIDLDDWQGYVFYTLLRKQG